MLIGASTGAFAELREDWSRAISAARQFSGQALELNAGTLERLSSLEEYLVLNPGALSGFEYVSLHAPEESDNWGREIERMSVLPVDTMVFHADCLPPDQLLSPLGKRAGVENMDHNKQVGQTADDLLDLTAGLPEARVVIDVAHAGYLGGPVLDDLLRVFQGRVAHFHLSKIDSTGSHLPLPAEDMEWLFSLPLKDAPWIWEELPEVMV